MHQVVILELHWKLSENSLKREQETTWLRLSWLLKSFINAISYLETWSLIMSSLTRMVMLSSLILDYLKKEFTVTTRLKVSVGQWHTSLLKFWRGLAMENQLTGTCAEWCCMRCSLAFHHISITAKTRCLRTSRMDHWRCLRDSPLKQKIS